MEKITTLIFSGSGLRGCAYVGAIKHLEEIGVTKQINTIAGTSLGALVASLLSIGYTSQELEKVMNFFDFNKHFDLNLLSLINNYGVDNFNNMKSVICLLFTSKGVKSDITFIKAYNKFHIELTMNATCLNTRKCIYFNYKNTPNMNIIEAIQSSMALPYIFSSVPYQGMTLIDGGILNNIILDLYKDQASSVLAIRIDISENSTNITKKISSIEEYTFELFHCIFDAYYKLQEKSDIYYHIINIMVDGKYHTFNFNLDNNDKKILYSCGYKSAKEFTTKNFTKLNSHKINLKKYNKLPNRPIMSQKII